jgi:hypothetical protein
MHLPTPTPRELRWSFYVAALAAIALTTVLIWAIVQRVNQSDDIVHVAASNADQVQRLSNQVDALTEQLVEQAAANQRQVNGLRAQNKAQRRQLTALVDYLRSHGLGIPKVAAAESGGAGRPKGSATSSGTSSPKPRKPPAPATPAPTSTPRPTQAEAVTELLCSLLPLPLICG